MRRSAAGASFEGHLHGLFDARQFRLLAFGLVDPASEFLLVGRRELVEGGSGVGVAGQSLGQRRGQLNRPRCGVERDLDVDGLTDVDTQVGAQLLAGSPRPSVRPAPRPSRHRRSRGPVASWCRPTWRSDHRSARWRPPGRVARGLRSAARSPWSQAWAQSTSGPSRFRRVVTSFVQPGLGAAEGRGVVESACARGVPARQGADLEMLVPCRVGWRHAELTCGPEAEASVVGGVAEQDRLR